MSIEATDNEAKAVQKGQRVALADIEAYIAERYDLNLARVLASTAGLNVPKDHPTQVMSLCVLVLKNGFVVFGESASADPVNFDAALGAKFAYENAVRKIWPLMGFNLRSKLHEATQQGA